MTKRKTFLLVILDGWGYNPDQDYNAIAHAKKPHWELLTKGCLHALLKTSGLSVGLPEGQMGNSEVGHMTIGAGRILLQSLPKITRALHDNTLIENPHLKTFIQRLKETTGRCHLLGLYSPGGVHSHEDHLLYLAKALTLSGIETYLHFFSDGRDTPPRSVLSSAKKLLSHMEGLPNLSVATLCGRYYAMDRDQRWERTQQAYEAIVHGKGRRASSLTEAIEQAYAQGKEDEFIEPTCIGNYKGIEEKDGLLMGNFRSDRVRQLLQAILDPNFNAFPRSFSLLQGSALGLVSYGEEFRSLMKNIMTHDFPTNTLGEVIAQHGLTQLRIAETEKYPHVTFFFNGGNEKLFNGERRCLISSPKVSTYDQKPEMAAYEVTDTLLEALTKEQYDFVVLNYANADMVGHTGNFEATVKAIEAVDECLGRIMEYVRSSEAVLLLTADHGNAELMRDPYTLEPYTSHTTNPVPLVLYAPKKSYKKMKDGQLCDIAPTILTLMGLKVPKDMEGVSLIE